MAVRYLLGIPALYFGLPVIVMGFITIIGIPFSIMGVLGLTGFYRWTHPEKYLQCRKDYEKTIFYVLLGVLLTLVPTIIAALSLLSTDHQLSYESLLLTALPLLGSIFGVLIIANLAIELGRLSVEPSNSPQKQ